jgi:hypothetical protein
MDSTLKSKLAWMGKRVGGWALFMGVTWLLLKHVYDNVPDHGKGQLTAFQQLLNTVFILPSWGLPIALSFANGGHARSDMLFNVGIGLHFLLWLAAWEWRAIRAYVGRKR